MKKVFCFAVSHYLSTLSTSCAALVCVDMLAMYRRAAGQSENPLRPKTYNYFAGELMEQGLFPGGPEGGSRPAGGQHGNCHNLLKVTPFVLVGNWCIKG